jgi:hypothetical protein
MSSRPVRPVEAPAAGRLALAALLERAEEIIECEVTGESMQPTLPAGSTLRIRPGRSSPPQHGEVIAMAIRDRLIAHRVVRADRGTGHILTRGDADLLPDPPVALEWIVGRVVEAKIDGRWQPVPPPPHRPLVRTISAGLVFALVAALMSVNLALADRLAHILIRVARRAGSAGDPWQERRS